MRKGSTEPRIFTPPLRPLTEETTLGFLCIEYAETVLQKVLYPWQKWALVHVLEIVGDLAGAWHFRFRTVLIMVARQNGKTVLSEILASFFLNVLGVESVLGTSLSLDKAEEVWEAVVADQEAQTELKREIKHVGRTNGNKRLQLKGGRTYKVKAPTRRAGRGDSNDLVMMDETRELRDWETWSAAAASIVAKPNGIIIGFTNAGDPDSVVLRQIRSTAMAAIGAGEAEDLGGDLDAETLGLFEWSAPEGSATNDMDALAAANPALGYGRLTERALMGNRATYTEAKFRAEHMCQQVATILRQPFPDGAWEAGTDATSRIETGAAVFYGVDLSDNRAYATIAAAGLRADGNYHIEVIARRSGTEWVIDWFRERAQRAPMKLAFQSRGAPVSGLAEQVCTLHGVERVAIEGGELTAGWGRFYDAIAASAPAKPGEEPRAGLKIYHLPQPVLDAPAKTMQLKKLGGGSDVPDRVKSPDDIAPLFACVMAFTAATMIQGPQKIYESSYANGSTLLFV